MSIFPPKGQRRSGRVTEADLTRNAMQNWTALRPKKKAPRKPSYKGRFTG